MADREELAQQGAAERLLMLDAILLAIERRTEVFDLVTSSPSADVAREELMALLGISFVSATAVMDLQVRRFGRREVGMIRAERESLRLDLEA